MEVAFAPSSPSAPADWRDAARIRIAVEKLLRAAQAWDRERACCYGLTASQCHALQLLYRRGPMAVGEFSRALHLEKSSASRMAGGLLKKGLLRRRSSPGDGRRVILQVSEAGRILALRIQNELTRKFLDLLAETPPEERGVIAGFLERLAELIAADGPLADSSPCCRGATNHGP